MSTTLQTINASAIKAVRVNKSNKETYRDLLGILISGNPTERLSAASNILSQDWANGDMTATFANLRRVFGEKKVDSAVNQLNDKIAYHNEQPETKVKTSRIDNGAVNKQNVLQIVQTLILAFPDPKGEKAKLLTMLRGIADRESAAVVDKEARKIAFEAEKALGQATTATV